jgi:hypothetical protein
MTTVNEMMMTVILRPTETGIEGSELVASTATSAKPNTKLGIDKKILKMVFTT